MTTIEDLKERWFNAYPEVMGISGDQPIQCYGKKDVDECLAGIEAVPHTDNSDVIARLLDERRWRKFSEEKPDGKQWILVYVENPSKYGTYIELRRWDMGCKFDVENQELYTHWMPLPSAPKDKEDDV